MKRWSSKQDNSRGSTPQKLELRNNVLNSVRPCNVLDVFCGEEGVQWKGCWSKADSYVGCDKRWICSDRRRRFVGDSYRVLRCIDLSNYNVFDVDTYGSPWRALRIIGQRRKWRPEEMGGIVFTDAHQFGQLASAQADLVGVKWVGIATSATREVIWKDALHGWCKECNVTPVRIWQYVSRKHYVYAACVFAGNP